MKTLGVIIMALTLAQESTASLKKTDELKIKNTIQAVATLADNGDFDALKTVFAPVVKMDYTSLFGGNPEVKSSQILMESWAGVLPGFDSTRHEISAIQVQSVSNKITATANVKAEHMLDNQVWIVAGFYKYEFVQDGDQYRVSGMTFVLQSEEGSRELIQKAVTRAKSRRVPFIERIQTVAVVRKFLESLEKKDMKMFAEVWADDAVQDMPYSPKGFPRRVSGKDNLLKHYSAWPNISGKAKFLDGIVFHPMRDPQRVFVEYRGEVEIIPTQRIYKQIYGGLFHVSDGKIELFREYYDPNAFAEAFGLNEGGKFN